MKKFFISSCTLVTCCLLYHKSFALPAPVITYISFDNTQCNPCNGAIDISVIDGKPPYTYMWSTGALTQDVSALCGGSYSVTVTDKDGKKATAAFVITNTSTVGTSPLAVSKAVTPNTVCQVACTRRCFESLTIPNIASAYSSWTINQAAGTVTIRTVLAKTFVDNTYGINSIGWTYGHKFTELTGSDHLIIALYDAANGKKLELKMDYLTASASAPSGYKSLGVWGGDGAMIFGSAADVLSVVTSLDVNFNTFGYVLTTNSPATNSSYVPHPAFPNWIFDVWYECTVKLSAFGTAGFGRPEVTWIHASPSKTGNNSETLVDKGCCGYNCTGSVNLTIQSGPPPFHYLWSNGATTEDLVNACDGNYTVTITDGNGCTLSFTENVPAQTCDDNNPCSIDLCMNASCFHIPFNCDDGNPLSADICNADGSCTHICNDGNACTADAYSDGNCIFTPVSCSDGNNCTIDHCNLASGCFHIPFNCDDGNPLSADICNTDGSCTHICSDGSLCTTDSYFNGNCIFSPISCSDGNVCTIDNCNSITGCFHIPFNCDDGNPQSLDACVNGACTHTCNDGNACTADTYANGICMFTPFNCDDGNPQSMDICINGTCNHMCNDGNTCTADSYVNGNCLFQSTCTDNDLCTADQCVNSICVYTPLCEDDNNPCTDDFCRISVAANCVHVPKDCNDHDFCTIDQCNAANGNCVYSRKNCDDNIECTIDACSGQCTHDASQCHNPDFDIICPPRMIIVLDESGSIAGYGQGSVGVTQQVRSGLTGMFTALAETDILVAVVEFNTRARRAVIGGTSAYRKVKGNLSSYLDYASDNNTTADHDHFDPEDYLNNTSNAFTNWEDALKLVQAINASDGLAPLVLFFTDGMPTAYNNSNGTVTQGTGSVTVAQALAKAVAAANDAKAQGSHIFVVAFPNPNLPEANVQAISGPDRYPSPESDFTRADYSIESSASLENSLKAVASLLCKADLRLSMKVNPANACPGDVVTFMVRITNDGLDKADTVQVKNYIPNGYVYLGNTRGAPFSSGVITWHVGGLINTQSDSMGITLSIKPSGIYRNAAEITYSNKGDTDSRPNNFSGIPLEDDEAVAAPAFINCSGINFCTAHAQCNDGNACTADVCSAGLCFSNPVSCNDNNSCTADGCNPASGCTFSPIAGCNNNPCVTSFTLVNSATDLDIRPLLNGDVINLFQTPSVNVRANPCTSTGTASVKFNLNGSLPRIENIAPWALAGDVSGNYNKWNVAPGTYTIQAIPYSGSNASGTAGAPLSVTVTVISGSAKLSDRSPSENTADHETKLSVYPNPFRDLVNFEFSVTDDAIVTLQIFSITGAVIATPFEGPAAKNIQHRISFYPENLSGGFYYCRLITNETVVVEKIWLTR